MVEMLAVLAVLSVLSAVIYPAFQHARAQAERVECLGNMRQIMAAMIVYTSDHNGRLPTQAKLSFPYTDWSARLTNYLGHCWDPSSHATVFKCPSDSNRRNKVAPFYDWKFFWRSYAVNGTNAWCSGYQIPWPGITNTPRRLAEVPLHVFLVGENHGIDGGTAPGMSGAYIEVSEMESLQGHASANHGPIGGSGAASTADERGGGNYGFADGRVEFHYRSEVKNETHIGVFNGGRNDPWKWK